MPGTRKMDLQALVRDFAQRVTDIVELALVEQMRAVVLDSLDGKTLKLHSARPAPQLCPVPNCQKRAAPVFGMVCSDHKDLPKAKIRQYREARRAAKTKPAGRARAE